MRRFADPRTVSPFAALVIAACVGVLAAVPSTTILAASPIAAPVAGPPHPAMPLAAHRASYRITLADAVGSKSPTAARGRVAYEFTGSPCEGYSQTFRQVTELQPAEGPTRISDMRSATFEDGAGRDFSFNIRTGNDGAAPEVVDGHAERRGSDVLAIRLKKPAEQTADLGDDVLFPTAHLARIIAGARAGQRMLAVKVFDGSDDGKKVYDTMTIIGRPLTGAADEGAAHVAAMDAMPRWPVTISYFEEGRKDQGPAYVLGFELYENGVSRALRFDYGDFVLAGQMVSLDLQPGNPQPACPR